MRWHITFQLAGFVVFFVGLAMAFPLAFSLYYRDGTSLILLQSLSLSTSFGLLLILLCRSKQPITLSHREGMAIVTLSWIGAGLFGSLPFHLSGLFPSFVDCVFETMSGFTTTGASILGDIERLPPGLLMWRSLTHWLGGMGIILLSLAVLPFLGVGGMQLYKAEVPGPTPDKLRPRIKDTAILLWKVYLFLSLTETLLLLLGGMDFFNALCHTFGTMATGGFSPKNASIGHYSSLYIQMVITLFMFLAGTNFALHFRMLQGRPGAYLQNSEFRFYLGAVLAVTLCIGLSLWGPVYDSIAESLRYGVFQAVSILTTTGYVTADYEQWTPLAQVLLLLGMFLGGCAGSTGGGIKCMRMMLLSKQATRELKRLVHPRAVLPIKLGGKIVPEEVISGIWGFFLLYLGLTGISAILLALLGVDVLTSFAAAIACIGNIGPGLGQVGPADNYAAIPDLGKWLLTFCMLLGRLEIYTVIILLFTGFWRK
jgi:trk system potassium uptake protein TrkH